jgi:hypothetical protein
MLNKLMKYEFKATSRLLVPLYLLLFFMSIINRFTFKLYDYEGVVGIINKFLIFTYVTTIFVVLVVTVFYMIIRFYKNILTDEGYLMFTLPAKTHQLITSKLLSTICWTIISIIAVILSLFIVFATLDSLPAAINGIKEAIASFNREFGGNWVLTFTEIFIMCLLSLVANILLIFVSIAVGQLYSKHKLIGSFAAYMMIYTVIQFLMIIIFIPFGMFLSKNPFELSFLPQVIFPAIIVILMIGCAGFYLATNYIFKRKLNLD